MLSAAMNNAAGNGPLPEYRNDIFEQASVLHQNANVLQDVARHVSMTDNRRVVLNAGKLMVSYTIPYSSFVVQPQVGIANDHITQKGHKFRSDDAALDVKRQKLDFLTVFTGVRVSTDTLMNGRLKPYVFIGFTQDVHRHADVAKKVKASYGPVSAPINAVSYPGKRWHLMTSAGIEFMATDAISVDVSYH